MSRGFPLATLLDLARRAVETARADLGAAVAEEGRRRAERDRAGADLAAHRARRAAALAAGRTEGAGTGAGGAAGGAAGPAAGAGHLLVAARHAVRLAEEEGALARALARREADLARAAGEAARRQAVLAGARARERVLEGRRTAWERARTLGRDRAEQDEADDRVSAARRAGA